MNTHTKHRHMQLRISVALAMLLTLGLLYAPTFVLVHDAYAQPAPATQPATKTVQPSTPAATPAAAPAETKPAETKETAPATTEKEQSWWQAMLVPVLGVVGMFIAAFLAAGLRKLVLLIEKKWSIDIPDSVEKLMYDKARWAVGWAEEQAEKRLLYGDKQKTDGAKKLADVVDLLQKFATNLGYGEEWQRDKVEQLVEGVLHLERGVTVGTSDEVRDTKVAEAKNGNG